MRESPAGCGETAALPVVPNPTIFFQTFGPSFRFEKKSAPLDISVLSFLGITHECYQVGFMRESPAGCGETAALPVVPNPTIFFQTFGPSFRFEKKSALWAYSVLSFLGITHECYQDGFMRESPAGCGETAALPVVPNPTIFFQTFGPWV